MGTKKKLTDKEFKIGDIIEYNNMLFYVIKNSTKIDDSVTLLKAEPLTVTEVNKYGGVGTDNNHVNAHVNPSESYYQTALDRNGYGAMQYYSSSTCGYDSSGNYSTDGCTTDYGESEVKYVVDAWAADKTDESDLIFDDIGYKARLISYEDLTNYLGYKNKNENTIFPSSDGNTPNWVYDDNYQYWTMSPYRDSTRHVWGISTNGNFNDFEGQAMIIAIRPVITLKKPNYDVVDDKVDEIEEEIEESIDNNQIIKVPDTLLNNKIILVVIGIILIITSVVIIVLIKRRKTLKETKNL